MSLFPQEVRDLGSTIVQGTGQVTNSVVVGTVAGVGLFSDVLEATREYTGTLKLNAQADNAVAQAEALVTLHTARAQAQQLLSEAGIETA